MSSIEGRIDDLLYTVDGRVLGRLDPVFKGTLPIRAAQIIQEELDRVRVRYIPTGEFTRDSAKSIVCGIRARMGNVEVVLEQVEDLPRQANGKFRAVICNLSPEKIQAISARSAHGI
jgi:phenylacetate-CoA ligase